MLVERLTRLRADTDALDTLPARTGLLHRLRARGSRPAGRRPRDPPRRPPPLTPAELDLALVEHGSHRADPHPRTPSLTQATTAPPSAGCRGQYAALDRQHIASLSGPVLAAVVGHVSATLRQHREQAESLFAELVEERLTSLRDTFARHPDVARRLRPA